MTLLTEDGAIELLKAHRTHNSLECTASEISPEAASLLAQWPGHLLMFRALKELNAEAAEALSTWKGTVLVLGNEVDLSAEAAGKLARWKGGSLSIALAGCLHEDVAAALAAWSGDELILDGVSSLDDITAQRVFSSRVNVLSLLSFTTLSLRYLSSWEGDSLYLGIERLGRDDAEDIARWKGKILYLGEVKSLTLEVAQILLTWKIKKIYLEYLEDIPPEVDAVLRSYPGGKVLLPKPKKKKRA